MNTDRRLPTGCPLGCPLRGQGSERAEETSGQPTQPLSEHYGGSGDGTDIPPVNVQKVVAHDGHPSETMPTTGRGGVGDRESEVAHLSPTLEVTVPGEPVGKGRARFDPRSGRAYTPKTTRRWLDMAVLVIRAAAKRQQWVAPERTVPIRVEIAAVKRRPKRLAKRAPNKRRRRVRKPDGDNVEKAVLDALTKAGVYADDAQVHSCAWGNWYAETGVDGCVEVRVIALEGVDGE